MINETYIKAFVDNLLYERYFSKDVSPSSDQIDALYEYARGLNLSANGSRVSFMPLANTESSASQINNTLKTTNIELKAIKEGTKILNEQMSLFYNGIENNLSRLNQRVSSILLASCGLQVARQNGFSLVYAETFTNLDKINQLETSTEVDFSIGAVTLKRAINQHRYDLSYLKNEDFDVFIINGEYGGFGNVPGSSYLNIVDDLDGFWMTRLSAIKNEPKTIALQIDLKKELTCNEIEFRPFSSDQAGSQYIRVLGSLDSINWRVLFDTQKITTKIVNILFPSVKLKYLRFEMKRDKPSFATLDGVSSFIYEFGIDRLHLYKSQFFKTGDFISKPIEFKGSDGIAQNINKLYFEPYHELPFGTSITYYLATDVNNISLLIKIEPNNIIELNTIDSLIANGRIRSRFDSQHALINIDIPSDAIPESIKFFRNIYQNGVLIDGVAAGWRYDNSYYSCIFEITTEREINLGINYAYLNGKKVNGIQVISPGIYNFRTHENNWVPAISDATDPLYPYNHKLLIEGLNDSAVYFGADFIAAAELQLVSQYDLINYLDNNYKYRFFGLYGSYPIVKIDKPPAIINTIEGWRKEQYQIRYKIPSTSKQPIKQIVLVGKFNSVSPAITPKLIGYIMGAGY